MATTGNSISETGPHRRRRGAALSCQECRRLKLKCSRVFPCSNCVKKGCGPICPEGSLTTGKGNRFVLANTEVLHEKIGQLATRVRALEDALSATHRLNSNTVHPLLSDDLLQIKRPLERERLDSLDQPDPIPDPGDSINAIGSLSISEKGRSTFFGQAANSWYLLKNEEGSDEEKPVSAFEHSLPSDLPWLAHSFPFTGTVSSDVEEVRASVMSYLPDVRVAQHLCNVYYRHAAWMYTPIAEPEFYESVFRPIYAAEPFRQDVVHPHVIAIMFMVLALGTLVDLQMEPHSPESMQFYQVGRAALAINPVLENPSIPGIQALVIMCHFMFWKGIEGPRWAVMGIIVKLAQSVGLHRDSGNWNLDDEETYRRRCLLWEIFTYDTWQSFTFGRPPSFSLAHIDSKLPHQSTKNASGEVEMSFAAWKHAFCQQCLSVVQDKAWGAHPTSYKIIQDLDKKIRLYYIPPSLQVPGFGGAKLDAETSQPSIELVMQRHIVFAIKEMFLFYMHRGFFARAFEDNPADPMSSKYAPSVLAAYTDACSFVGLVESLHRQHPQLTERMFFLFTHVMSCSIVLGSIAAKAHMAIAPSALSHLDSAYNLFRKVSDHERTAKILPILQKLKERAHTSLAIVNSPSPDASGRSPPMNHPFTFIKQEEDALAPLGGGTRLVPRRGTSSTPSSPSNPGSTGSPASQPPTSPIAPIAEEARPSSLYPAMNTEWQTYNQVQDYNTYSAHYGQSQSPPVTYSPPQFDVSHQRGAHDYYAYTPAPPLSQIPTYNQEYSGYVNDAMMPNDFAIPNADLTNSWYNLVAQYNN